MIPNLSNYCTQAHASYGKNVGKHFPLWVCAYTALAATATFFILVGMKRFNVSLGALQKTLQPIQHRLGSTGCLTSFIAGSLLGGMTLGLVSLPAWGKGHKGFLKTFVLHSPEGTRPTFFGYVFMRLPAPPSPHATPCWVSVAGRIAYTVEAVSFCILGLLDVMVGLVALSLSALTLGKHAGCTQVAKTSLRQGSFALLLSFVQVMLAVLPNPRVYLEKTTV